MTLFFFLAVNGEEICIGTQCQGRRSSGTTCHGRRSSGTKCHRGPGGGAAFIKPIATEFAYSTSSAKDSFSCWRFMSFAYAFG